jgi:hypothetical protein
METKYTTDGKKVLVVGKLNNTETIVQEIFVAQNGQEIPSGENFVVKSLHDLPVESWKAKKLRELEEKYEKNRKAWEDRIEKQNKRYRDAEAKAKLKADSLLNFVSNGNEEQIELLKSFMVGEITHFFVKGYSPTIVTFDDEMFVDDYYTKTFDSLKLISLHGTSKGDLSYRINRYGDGSGNYVEVIPTKSYQEALNHAQEFFNEKAKKYLEEDSHLDIEKWEKIGGLHIPQEVRDKAQRKKDEDIRKRIAKLKEELSKLEKEI